MHRRTFLKAAGSAAASVGIAAPALAQGKAWPDKPVKLILPYPPGGSTDLIGRPWAEALTQAFGQQFVIENRGGAGGMIGAEAASKAAPDGYTFLLTANNTLSILPQLRKTPYDPLKSFAPVGRVGDLVCGFTVHPSTGIKTFKELIAHAKANPGKLSYGSAGLGTATHMRLEMLKFKAGLDILHVPYRGSGEALNDLLANNVQMMNEVNVIPHVKAGKLTLLNINHAKRHAEFPQVPTLAEEGFSGADVPIWFGVFAPAGTPADIIATMNAKMLEIAKQPNLNTQLGAINVAILPQTSDELGRFLAQDITNNGELIKAAKIKLDG